MKKIVCLAVAAFSAAVIGLSAGCGGQGFSKQVQRDLYDPLPHMRDYTLQQQKALLNRA